MDHKTKEKEMNVEKSFVGRGVGFGRGEREVREGGGERDQITQYTYVK